jgi:hypothetical protein
MIGYGVALISTAYIGSLLWFVVHMGMNVEQVYGTVRSMVGGLFGS